VTVVADKLVQIHDRITAACLAAGRRVDSIELVAVSKRINDQLVLDACRAGQWAFGENRIQDALQRVEHFPWTLHEQGIDSSQLRWHFVGTLQKNKVRKAVGAFSLIHGVDSLELAERIDLIAGEMNIRQAVLLQINASQEPQKHGLDISSAADIAAAVLQLPNVDLQGMMTMTRSGADESEQRRTFASVRKLAEDVRVGTGAPLPTLSMGMSGDFETAIAEGATSIRVGTAIFGHRTD
jgi:hypothetical protein